MGLHLWAVKRVALHPGSKPPLKNAAQKELCVLDDALIQERGGVLVPCKVLRRQRPVPRRERCNGAAPR